MALHYTAPPILEAGTPDPVARRSGIRRGLSDTVDVPAELPTVETIDALPVALDGEELTAADLEALAAAVRRSPAVRAIWTGDRRLPGPQLSPFPPRQGVGAGGVQRCRHSPPRAGCLRSPSRRGPDQDHAPRLRAPNHRCRSRRRGKSMTTIDEVVDAAVAAAAEATRGAVPTDDDSFAERVLLAAGLPRADYERARAAIARELGIRVTALDGFVKAARQASGEEQARASQRDALVAIAVNAGELWRDEAEDAYATVRAGDHAEHYKVRSAGYRRWLIRRYGDENKIQGPKGEIACAPGSQALTEAIAAIEANACRGPLDFPKLRLAGSVKSEVEIDLCDTSWRAVRVDRNGWEVVATPRYRFLRAAGMLALPEPKRGDGEAKLKRHLALDDTNYRLVLGWLVGALCPSGPYPIVAIHGEQGSGKSTLVRMLRRLVDPNRAGDRSKPKDERDLVIAASNSWLVCFDNLSRIDELLSDGLCRIATGAGFGTRTLYSDDAETLFQVCRPQMVNGIPDLARSGDLVDRCITVLLPPREEARTAYEADLWAQFDADLPEMLGFLLDAVSCALRRLESVHLSERPRLADFARWVEAAAPALGWPSGAFLDDYLANREDGAAALVEGDALAALLVRVVAILVNPFDGTASDLRALLGQHATDDEKKAPGWPKNARALSSYLRRLAPALRKTGILVAKSRSGHARSVRLERLPNFASFASSASFTSRTNGLGDDANGEFASSGDQFASSELGLRHPAPSKSAGSDANDANDANPPPPSRPSRRVIFPPPAEIDL